IALIECNTDNASDIFRGVQTAAGLPGVSVISMSIGYTEGHDITAAGEQIYGSSGGSVQALKKVDVLAQSVVGSIILFRLETQHVHQLVVPCVRDSGIHLHSDSLRWRNHPLCHRPGGKTVVLL